VQHALTAFVHSLIQLVLQLVAVADVDVDWDRWVRRRRAVVVVEREREGRERCILLVGLCWLEILS